MASQLTRLGSPASSTACVVTIRQSKMKDIPDLARLMVEGYKSEPSMRLRYAALNNDVDRRGLEEQEYGTALAKLRKAQLNKDCITEVVVSDGRVVAMASWRVRRVGGWIDPRPLTSTRNRPRKLTMLKRATKAKVLVAGFVKAITPAKYVKRENTIKEDADVVRRANLMELKRVWKRTEASGAGHMVLEFLAVLPEYRRRGIATALITRERERSDKDLSQITAAAWNSAGKLFEKLCFVRTSTYELEQGGERERIMQYGVVEDTCRGPTVFE